MFQLDWFYQLHTYLITLGILLLITSVYIVRFKKDKPWRIKRHKLLALISVISITSGVLSMFIGKRLLDFKHFYLPHHWGGAIALILLFVTPSLAILALKGKPKLMNFHRWFGRITFFITVVVSVFGLTLLLSYI